MAVMSSLGTTIALGRAMTMMTTLHLSFLALLGTTAAAMAMAVMSVRHLLALGRSLLLLRTVAAMTMTVIVTIMIWTTMSFMKYAVRAAVKQLSLMNICVN